MTDAPDNNSTASEARDSDMPASETSTLMLGDCPLAVFSKGELNPEQLSPDIHWFWQLHPRITFVKGLALGSTVLDFGAGNGSFFKSRTDYLPLRPDQKFFAIDLFKGENFDQYDDYQVADFEDAGLKWQDGSIDAIFACHVIEHLHGSDFFLKECFRVLKPGGLIYIETPAVISEKLPNSSTIREQGWPVIACNFFEDSTHVRAISNKEIADAAQQTGFVFISGGIAKTNYFADVLLHYARATNEQMYGMFGLWAKIGWAQFMSLQKPCQLDTYFGSLT